MLAVEDETEDEVVSIFLEILSEAVFCLITFTGTGLDEEAAGVSLIRRESQRL